jgi:cytochrome P450 family 110
MSSLPSGPPSRTLQTIEWLRGPVAMIQKYTERYGDPFLANFWAFGPTACTSTPEGIRAIFTAPPAIFASNVGVGAGPLLGEKSIFVLDGASHKRQRALMMPAFHGERMRAYGTLMQDIALSHATAWQPGQAFRMYDVTQAISLEAIIQAIFGVQAKDRVKLFEETIFAFVRSFTPLIAFFTPLRVELGGLGPWSRFKKAEAQLLHLMMEEIRARRQALDVREDILSLLIAARLEDGSTMTDEELVDELKSLIFAGHETVAIATAWALYFIYREPHIYRRLRAELEPLGRTPDPEDLVQLPYLSATCDEALRLHPSVSGVPRKLKQPLSLQGYDLPPGVAVFPSISTAHLNPIVYPDPLRFQPERFLERKYTPFEYLPFGGGGRRCVGAAFALYEMKIVLGSILAQHRLSLAEEQPVRPVTRTFTYAPKGGVKMLYQGRVESENEFIMPFNAQHSM